MSSDTSSIRSASSKPKTPTEGGKKVGFVRPTLIIPPPRAHMVNSPYTAHLTCTPGTAPPPEMYGRKASTFMFAQFNGIKDFTMHTAKSGMGIGERCSYWMYKKIKSWSKKWFTHFFLSIVLLIYTVGGALTFITLEGPTESTLVVRDTRRDMYQLIRQIRNLSIAMPQEDSIETWEKEARLKFDEYKLNLIDAHQKTELIAANNGNKLWTMWNAIVFCATVYTSIELPPIETEPADNGEDDDLQGIANKENIAPEVSRNENIPLKRRGISEISEDDSGSEIDFGTKSKRNKLVKMGTVKGIKRGCIKNSWDVNDKKAVFQYFSIQIKNKIVPGKADCEACQAEYTSLKKRKWTDIKFYVKNQIAKTEKIKKK